MLRLEDEFSALGNTSPHTRPKPGGRHRACSIGGATTRLINQSAILSELYSLI